MLAGEDNLLLQLFLEKNTHIPMLPLAQFFCSGTGVIRSGAERSEARLGDADRRRKKFKSHQEAQ